MTYKKHFALLSSLVLLALLVFSCNTRGTSEYKESHTLTSPGDSSDRILEKEKFASDMKKSGAVLIDVRMPQEFEQGHIEGAININFFDPEFKFKLLELNKQKKYYLYCKNETRSYRSMKFMETNDFKNVYILKGGYEKWKEHTIE